MRRAGFTLIELLVVVAIIALLLAILTPVLKRVRAQAYEVSCRSNLHQVHLAVEAYANGYKGWYPLEPTEMNPHRTLLDTLRAEPSGLIDAMYCPQGKRMEPAARSTEYPPAGHSTSVIDTPENREAGNIGYFYWSFKDRSLFRKTKPVPADQYDEAAEKMDSFRPRHLRSCGKPVPFKPSLNGDGVQPHPNTPCALQSYRPGEYWVLSDFFRKKAPFPHTRKHKQGLNVLYLDGHADWMYGQPRANFK